MRLRGYDPGAKKEKSLNAAVPFQL